MYRRFSVFVVIVLVLGLILTGCASTANTGSTSTPAPAQQQKDGPVLSRINETKVMKVGFEGTYSPFNYKNQQGQFEGFDVDVSNEIAKRLGVKTEFIATPWSSLIGGLEADKFDIIIAQMSITDERKKSVDFTDPYVITGGVIITRQDTKDITKLEDLKGKKVGVGAGTTFEETAKKVQGANVISYKSAGDYFMDLQNKRLDAIINDNLVAGYRIKHDNLPLQIVSGLVSKDEIGMAIKKGNTDFVDKVNKALSDMKADGTYDSLFMKWFGVKPIAK